MSELTMFTNQYSLAKTLRFGLIPVENTQAVIDSKGIIALDQELADNYQKMKSTLDAYHADFIDLCLSSFLRNSLKNLGKFYELYTANESEKHLDSYRNNLKKTREALRREIAECFRSKENDNRFRRLFKKELIKTDIPKWLSAMPEDARNKFFFDESFVNRFGYFDGYNKNRENLYSAEAKASAISYRVIDQNLPKFIDNMKIFIRLQNSELAEAIEAVEKGLEEWIAGKNLASMFELDAYNSVLTQKGIDAYNVLIGGIKTERGVVKGLNGYINEYNQTHSTEKIPQMQKLFKQLLSPKEKVSWLPESFTDAKEVLDAVSAFYNDTLTGENGLLWSLESVIKELLNNDLSGILVRNDAAINSISVQIFRDYRVIKDALEKYYEKVERPDYEEKVNKAKSTKVREKLQKEKQSFIDKSSCFSIRYLQSALEVYVEDKEDAPESFKNAGKNCIADYFAMDISAKVAEVQRSYADMLRTVPADYSSEYQFTEDNKKTIKGYLDSVLELLHFCKPLYPNEDENASKDSMFYGKFSPLYEQLKDVILLYDKVRNFVTKKPYSKDKIKLNFQLNGNALNGWVDSKTSASDNGTQYGGYLFRKRVGQDYNYYLGISKNTKLFREFVMVPEGQRSEYERLNYKQIKGESIFGSQYARFGSYKEDKRRLEEVIIKFVEGANSPELYSRLQSYCESNSHTPSGCLLEVKRYSEQLYMKLLQDESFSALNIQLIDNLKDIMADMKMVPGAEKIVNKKYQVFTEAIEDISAFSETAKTFEYFCVNQKELENALNDIQKPLYLFKITNKDLSYNESVLAGKRRLNPKRHENLHTMYFRALMGGIQNVYDIGSGEVFFRAASIKRNITHPQGNPIESKNPNRDKKSVFTYDLIKDRRFSEDKYEFHLSITQNYTCGKVSKNYNTEVREFLKNNLDINILGIDRGENNLLYISLIDREGNIMRDENGKLIQYSLNDIHGNYLDYHDENVAFTTPYQKLLDQRERENREAKESWGTVGKIKDLKAGYMSQVVSIISKLMVKHNAIVVLEDLNGSFKRGRQKVEKQVYQNFERALIQKLNYLVLKDVPVNEPGGLYNALQLADQFNGFQNLRKQSGFIFYVPAWKTSLIDPETGFVNLLKLKYENREKARNLIEKFECIHYNADMDWFEFAFDYAKLLSNPYGHKTDWVVCTHGKERYFWNPRKNNNKGAYEKVDVTASLKRILDEQGIAYQDGEDLRRTMAQIESADFYKELLRMLKITLDMRYKDGKGRDYILSPVSNDKGEFFSSLDAQRRDLSMPQDADANGAFNIARKGLFMLRSIDACEDVSKWDARLMPKEWVEFAQELCGNLE